MKKLTVIDGDSIGYICSKDNIRDSLDSVNSLIQTIVSKTKADFFTIALSETPYFRTVVDPQYKANRQPSKLKYLKTIKSYLKEEYKAFSWKLVEADDILGWYNHNVKNYDITLASIDKDVLQSLPGNGYDYKNHKWVVTSEDTSNDFLKYQLLVGDAADNILGLRGYGKKKAEKFFSESRNDLSILELYINNIGSIEGMREYFKNRRLLYILRTDADFKGEVNYIPSIANIELFINEVKRPEIEF